VGSAPRTAGLEEIYQEVSRPCRRLACLRDESIAGVLVYKRCDVSLRCNVTVKLDSLRGLNYSWSTALAFGAHGVAWGQRDMGLVFTIRASATQLIAEACEVEREDVVYTGSAPFPGAEEQ
jgi:hypothetical protein